MTRRSRLLTTATAGVTAALLLAGCGGGDGGKSKSNDKIAGADTGASSSASPSASASAAASGRPKIALPAGDTLTFTPDQDSDPVKNAILTDNAEFVRALDAAIGAQNPRLPALEYYTEGEGAVAAQQWVRSFVDGGLTVTGIVRYYDRQVTVESKSTASLTYCGDESKGYNKVIKTGVVKKTKTTKNSYVAYGVQVEKNAKGVWELVKIASTRGADKCQP
ncbi:hypothetical protein [Streptomyces shenzhenensis]|uniref:hypothetical protein n=1 Tax=Streptomyces shenzhenensis TaxID=943815 RepID=UPI001F15A5F6|nr:hypothetical protein [Streptomyces shenzhenensis]